nr:MAG TPA: hypothetical protein [Caudoviricetes sp.]
MDFENFILNLHGLYVVATVWGSPARASVRAGVLYCYYNIKLYLKCQYVLTNLFKYTCTISGFFGIYSFRIVCCLLCITITTYTISVVELYILSRNRFSADEALRRFCIHTATYRATGFYFKRRSIKSVRITVYSRIVK